MPSKKVLRQNEKLLQDFGTQNLNSDWELSPKETYFVNLKIINTTKGNTERKIEDFEPREKGRFKELQKSHANNTNQEGSENYLATTTAELSRRDRVPSNNLRRGTFSNVNPILNKSISRVLIYGSPGTGKTTLCKKIVHDFYRKDLWSHLDEVVWIPLRQLKDEKFNQDQMNEEKLLKIFLNEEKLDIDLDKTLFVLDGWDEIQDLLSDPNKIKLVEIINNMKARKNLILTSRPYIQLDFAEYQRVLEITGFSDKNVRDYIKAVLQQNNRLSDEGDIMEYINNNLISDLVTIPIILEIFLFTWQEISTMDKNDIKITKLYETFILKLSKKFLTKTGRGVNENTLKELISGPMLKEFKILREMAKKWLKDGSLQFVYADFEKGNEKLEDKLPFLNSSSSGDWKVERSEFVHLTFLEFFAAFELINRDEEEFRQFVAENKFNPKYFVVFTFIAGLIEADLHNLKPDLPYRYSKDEKLDLYFDYLQSDPVDLAGKYIYMLLVDCLHECNISKSRETSIYQEMAVFANKRHYQSGINGSRVFASLRRFPLGLMKEYLNIGAGRMDQLYNYKYTFPQFTDDQVEKISKDTYTYGPSRLEVLCKQCSFSPYSSDVITKLLSFKSLSNTFIPTTYSNLPLSVLEKVVKLLMNKDLFETETTKKDFNKYKGIQSKDAIKLCGQLINITNDESIRDIITKLALSNVDEEILFFLDNVHEFVEEMPEALLGILADDKFSQNTTLCRKVMQMIRLFDSNSPALVEKLVQILKTDEKLKFQALKTIAYIFYKEEMPAEVADHALNSFKSLLDSEKERLQIQNHLLKDYLASTDRKSHGLPSEWKFDQGTYSVKGFINALKGRCSSFVIQPLIDIFLGTPIKDLPLDILREEERSLFKIFPFIVETKTEDGNLDIKTAICSIINSKEDSLREMVHFIDLDLICESIKEMLEGITGKDRNSNWKWTVKRNFYTLTEIQRYNVNMNCQQKCAPKYGDEKCVYHAQLLNSKVLRELFDSEGINLDSTIESAIDFEEDVFKTMMYICYEQSQDSTMLWEGLLNCGIEDSEYQEKITEYMLYVFGQDIEIELRATLLYYLSQRVHRLTKEQLTLMLKYEGEEKVYELDGNSNEDRRFLFHMAKYSESALLANHKFVKECEYFSEDEQTDLRKLSPSYDKFCREESDVEILQQIDELIFCINEMLNSPTTKEILIAITEYMKDSDIYKFDSKVKNISTDLSGYVIEWHLPTAESFFPAKYAKQYIITNYILNQDKIHEFEKLKKKIVRLAKKSFSVKVIQNIYEKLDDETLGPYFLNVLEKNSDPNIVSMLKCINVSSTERQKYYMAYALVQSLIDLNDDIPLYVFNNDLYMGASVLDKPALPNLNQYQRDILFNAKSLANNNGFNIQLCGIAPNVQSFKICGEKCSVMDLNDKEERLKSKTILDLSNQNIKETAEMEKILSFIKKYPVESLILSNNQITGELFEILLRNANETQVKFLILDNNFIDLNKLEFGRIFGDEDSYINQNKDLLLINISNNPTSIAWLENVDKIHNARKFSRKDSKGKVLVHGYNLNNANVILYSRN